MRNVFNNSEIQIQLEEKGYVVVPFIGLDEINVLWKSYQKYFSEIKQFPGGLYISIFEKDEVIKTKTHCGISTITKTALSGLLDHYKSVNSSFTIKLPQEDSIKELHLDLTATDETRFRSLILWVPLINVTVDNGCIFVVEGSHEYFATWPRETNNNPPFHSIRDHVWENYAVPVPMSAGEALLFDPRLIHGSKANKSNTARVSVVEVLVPEEAPVWMCVGKEPAANGIRLLDVYEFSIDNYHIQNVEADNPGYLRGVNRIDTIEQEVKNLTELEFDEIARR